MTSRPCVALLMACALLAISCGSPEDPVVGEDRTPQASVPSIQELLRLNSTSNFAVLMEGTAQGSTGPVLWRRFEDIERFDLFMVPPRGNIVIGDTTVLRRRVNDGGCKWVFGRGAYVDLDCASQGLLVNIDDLLVTAVQQLQWNMTYIGERRIIGRLAYCYRGESRSDFAAEICLSEQGLPLSVDSRWGLDGPVSLRAVAIPAPPVETDDLGRLPWDVASQGLPPERVCVDELKLPPIPEVGRYVEGLTPEELGCAAATGA